MRYYIITDTHFNHTAKMQEYCNRPADYEQKLFSSMSQIPEDAILIHLGDVNIGDDVDVHEKYIKPLKCKKILVRGNHDHKSLSWYQDHGWDFVCDSFIMNHLGKRLLFSHKPQPLGEWDLNLHGHFHNTTHRDDEFNSFYCEKHIKVAVEDTGYKAVLLDRFVF
jgi:calcineurin-like phosphoesterase family protein